MINRTLAAAFAIFLFNQASAATLDAQLIVARSGQNYKMININQEELPSFSHNLDFDDGIGQSAASLDFDLSKGLFRARLRMNSIADENIKLASAELVLSESVVARGNGYVGISARGRGGSDFLGQDGLFDMSRRLEISNIASTVTDADSSGVTVGSEASSVEDLDFARVPVVDGDLIEFRFLQFVIASPRRDNLLATGDFEYEVKFQIYTSPGVTVSSLSGLPLKQLNQVPIPTAWLNFLVVIGAFVFVKGARRSTRAQRNFAWS